MYRGWTPREHRPAEVINQRLASRQPEVSPGATVPLNVADAHLASLRGDVEALLKFAALGENMDMADEYGRTPLWLGSQANQPRVVKFLVNRGSNLEARDKLAGSTPLMVAAEGGHSETVSILMCMGADVTCRRWVDGATPLWLACAGGHVGTVEALLQDIHADPDVSAPIAYVPHCSNRRFC